MKTISVCWRESIYFCIYVHVHVSIYVHNFSQFTIFVLNRLEYRLRIKVTKDRRQMWPNVYFMINVTCLVQFMLEQLGLQVIVLYEQCMVDQLGYRLQYCMSSLWWISLVIGYNSCGVLEQSICGVLEQSIYGILEQSIYWVLQQSIYGILEQSRVSVEYQSRVSMVYWSRVCCGVSMCESSAQSGSMLLGLSFNQAE